MLFGETPSRIVISFAAENLDRVKAAVGDCPFEVIGNVAGENLYIYVDGKEVISSPVSSFETAWRDSLKNRLEN